MIVRPERGPAVSSVTAAPRSRAACSERLDLLRLEPTRHAFRSDDDALPGSRSVMPERNRTLEWTYTSRPPSSGMTKPKPLAGSKNLTVPGNSLAGDGGAPACGSGCCPAHCFDADWHCKLLTALETEGAEPRAQQQTGLSLTVRPYLVRR